MKNGIVIAGFSGIGKTTISKKYSNIIDLDSAEYAYDDSSILNIPFEKRKGMRRKPNRNWPQNYINAIKKAVEKFDIVLVWDRQDIVKEYLKNDIEFSLCYPDEKDLVFYIDRFKSRGNSEEYIKMKLTQYKDNMIFFKNLSCEKIILHNNETLEDYLLKKYELVKKEGVK